MLSLIHIYTYTRDGNPTLNLLETKLARLEKGEAAQMFASGMGAISASILTLAKAGDHIIIVNTCLLYTSRCV